MNISQILEDHKKWLNNDSDGERADLSFANLRSANLGSANLGSANLRSANLGSADLSFADLRFANLRSADLRSADLRSAKYSDFTIKKTPIQIQNLRYPILIFTKHIQIGCEIHKATEWEAFANKDIIAMDRQNAMKFWRRYKTILLEMCRQHRLDK